MSKPIRVDKGLMERAESAAAIYRRSLPKQIEYWAEIGRQVSERLDAKDLFSVFTGAAELRVHHRESQPVSSAAVLEQIGTDRAEGVLKDAVSAADVRFDVDDEGYLRRTEADGTQTRGKLVDGRFLACDPVS
ncbi:MAG: hypothetical protein AAFY44_15380 [Pseudomonadota bacterium]